MVSEYTSGSVYARVGQANSNYVTGVGIHVFTVSAIANAGFGVGGVNFVGKVSDYSIKEIIPTWVSTDADGVALDHAVSVADAGTNKVTCREANPTDTSNITIDSGDGAITVVDSATAIAAANLDQVCTLGDVYQLTGGSAGTIYSVAGQTSNTNKHSLQAQVRKTAGTGTSNVQLGAATGVVEITGSAFSELLSENLTPVGTTEVMKFDIAAGDTVEIILMQLEENTVASPIIYNDALSTATRAADVVTTLAPIVLSGPTGAIEFTMTPSKTGQTAKYSLGSTVDASNLLAVEMNATTIDLIKKVAATDYSSQEAYTNAKDTKARIQLYWGSSGIGIRAADASADITALSFHTDANTLAMPLGTDLEIGNQGGVNLFVGDYPVDDFKFYTSKAVAGWS